MTRDLRADDDETLTALRTDGERILEAASLRRLQAGGLVRFTAAGRGWVLTARGHARASALVRTDDVDSVGNWAPSGRLGPAPGCSVGTPAAAIGGPIFPSSPS